MVAKAKPAPKAANKPVEIDVVKAAAKAFRNCRKNHAKSRNVASYLTRHYLIGGGLTPPEADQRMSEANELLDEWFAARTNDAGFMPTIGAPSPQNDNNSQQPNDAEGAATIET